MSDGNLKTISGKRRKRRRPEAVAARVAAFVDKPPVTEGIIPLNPGFFKLQRMSAASNKRRALHKRVSK